MPIYQYKCLDCGHCFEEIQKYSDMPIETCPNCNGRTERLIGLSSFVLKGSGWYRDGYNKTNGKSVINQTKKELIKETK